MHLQWSHHHSNSQTLVLDNNQVNQQYYHHIMVHGPIEELAMKDLCSASVQPSVN